MRARQNDERLLDRESQNRGWAAPLPDFTTLPRANEATKIRVEWDTRDTMSSRIWSHTQDRGPSAVTATMLAAHPTHGAEAFMPSSGRQDPRSWMAPGEVMYYPASRKHLDPTARPTLPERSLFQHPAMDGFDVEGGGAAREVRSAVKEERAFWGEDTSQRMMTRAFEHQWITPTQSQNMALTQIAAAEQLRPMAGFSLGEKVKGPYEK